MLWARQQGNSILERYMKAVYEPFWKRELDVEDLGVIHETLRRSGAETDGFEDYALGPGVQENAALQAAAFDAGIFGVPTYLVRGEMYFGREHLPRIRWHLQGERGPAPDIAYEHRGAARSETSSTLEVTLDFANPECWLALAPTLALAERCGIHLDWQVLPSTPSTIEPATEDDSRGSRHRRFRAAYREHNTARYAPCALAANSNQLDTRYACMGLLWIKHAATDQVHNYLRLVFEGIWIKGKSYDSSAAIVTLLQEMGLETDDFTEYAESSGRVALEQAQHHAMSQGVPGTPVYMLGEEPFLGRQHLPLIQARLGY
jgi:2-hydroxychromene-2-carboxylate isomerase